MTEKDQNPTKPADIVDEPSHEEVAEQIQELDEKNESGPNETLRNNIEVYSHYSPVFASLGYTIIGALFVPAILYFVIYQLSPAYDLSTLRGAVHNGLRDIFLPLLCSLALTRSLVRRGLAQKYLGWSAELCDGLRSTLKSVIFFVLPMRFFYVALSSFRDGRWNDSLGRAAFLLGMLGFAFGLYWSSRRFKKWFEQLEETRPWYHSIRSFLLLFLPATPITLGVMAAIGYYFTAEEMTSRSVQTVLAMISIALLGGFCSRLLLIAQFGIKLRELKRNEDGEINNDESIDIKAITRQVNRLIRATAFVAMVLAAWQIWGNVLPTIEVLDDVQLWPGVATTEGGIVPWITPRDILVALGIAVLTYILSSNLPGLLEVTLLDRLPLDRGGRYAISFVVRYLVAVIGIFFACKLIGFSWNKVQWLAAGLTVGLGFGLQEIFANLVSGLIILIERPVRVGDVVTVSNTTGTVTKMALRATTILDHDYRELIVPNKKFITEDVMNWTLSDNKSRLVIKVGVAYGSDTSLVQNTLLKVASRHPLVVRDPEPRAAFCGFGNSTLDFELRVVIPTRDMFFKVTHELHMSVDEAFRQKKIEIAFPQQDIFIKNLRDFPAPIVGGPDAGTRGPGTIQGLAGTSNMAGGDGGSVPSAAGMQEAQSVNPSVTDQVADAQQRFTRLPLEELRAVANADIAAVEIDDLDRKAG
jgi:potassium efflux system protein